MAIWSLDFSQTPPSPLPPKKPATKISLPHLLSLTFLTKKQRIFLINCSNSLSSPLLEDPSSDLRIVPLATDLPFSPATNLEISNGFIRRLSENPQTESSAFEYYQKARENPNFRPDRKTLNLLTKGLLKHKQWSSISRLVEDFKAFDVFPDRRSCARLVGSCVKARKFRLAESLLGILGTKRGATAISAFGSAMHGYNKLHMYSSTVSVFNKMRAADLCPSALCYRWIMEACRETGDTKMVLSLFLAYKSKKSDDSALSVIIYSILCDSLGRSGRAFEALRYVREMEEEGISLNSSIYASLISSFAGVKEAEIAEDLFREARERGMVKDPAVFLKLVLMYVEVGLAEKTVGIVKEMREIGLKVSDCVLCAVVSGFVKERRLRASLRAFEDLISLGCEPGQVTYASVINVYCRLGLAPKAEALFSEMMEKGFDKCLVAYSNMISMYGKMGRVSDATRLLATMKQRGCEPNVWVYNSLLDMHGRLANLRQVEKLRKEMKRRKITPDKITYTSVIGAYSKAKKLDDSIGLYQEFRDNGGKVDRALAGVMVGVFSNSSRFNELIELLQEMNSEKTGLDRRLYDSALNSLRDAGLQVHVQWLENSFGFKVDET